MCVYACSSLRTTAWAQPDTTQDPLPTHKWLQGWQAKGKDEVKNESEEQNTAKSEYSYLGVGEKGAGIHQGQARGQGSGQKGQRRKEG